MEADTNLRQYSRAPLPLQSFLDDPDKNTSIPICLLTSPDISITNQKLRENVPNWKFVDAGDLMKIFSRYEFNQAQFISIVTDEAHLKQVGSAIAENMQGKVILVTKASIGEDLDMDMDNVISCYDNMDWDDLSPTHKRDIRDGLKKYFQLQINVEQQRETLHGQVLVDLINGSKPKLFKSLPQKLSYYVDRTLITRSVISNEIFKSSPSSILLFEGMERFELILLTGKCTDSSTNHIRRGSQANNFKFLTLDHPDHFIDISKNSHGPVHWLLWEHEKLQWVRSSGGLADIQQYVESSQNHLDEEEFVQIVDLKSDLPVVISDSPGMGKSALLASLGRGLINRFPERLVIFVNSTEFIREISRLAGVNEYDSILAALQNLACLNELEEAVLSSILKLKCDQPTQIELLLDGFDELSSEEFKVGLDTLKMILSDCGKFIRPWVFTRPHLLHKLENDLGVMGYKMKPFTSEEQVRAITSYWRRDRSDLDLEKLTEFADNCLRMVRSNMKAKDVDIAGIPLQCNLIGGMFENEAIQFAEGGGLPRQPHHLPIDSVTSLFEHFVSSKIRFHQSKLDSPKIDAGQLKKSHARLAVQLMFPEHAGSLNGLFMSVPITMEILLSVGILESSSTEDQPKFTHRTFAEYFIAWFVADRLGCQEDWWLHFLQKGYWAEELAQFLFQAVLKYEEDNEICSFSYTAICTFLNSSIKPHKNLPIFNFVKQIPAQTVARNIANACCYDDLPNIFACLVEGHTFHKYARAIFNEAFLLLAVQHAGVELVRLGIDLFQTGHVFNFHIQAELCRRTVRRGNFPIFQFLLEEKNLSKIIPDLRTLIHDCVAQSHLSLPSTIEDKRKILHLAAKIHRPLLEESDERGRTPLLVNLVHVQLITELINLGADVMATNENNETVLHSSVLRYPLSPEDYHHLLQSVPKVELTKLLHIRSGEGVTAMETFFRYMPLLPDTLDVFQYAGANFADLDNAGRNTLYRAVEGGKEAKILQRLIEYGAILQPSHLQIAADVGNPDAVELFLDKYDFDVNLKDQEGMSLLDRVIRSNFRLGRRFETGVALHKRGGTFTPVVNATGQNLLHLAAQQGNLDTVRLLLFLGMEVNAKDDYGNTALHLQFRGSWHKSYFEITDIFLKSGANPALPNVDGMTPLQIALENRKRRGGVDLRTLVLLNWTPDPDEEYAQESAHQDDSEYDENGDSLLHLAVAMGDERDVLRILTKYPHLIESRSPLMRTPLHYTPSNRKWEATQLQIVRCLLDHGADVYVKDLDDVNFLHTFTQVGRNQSSSFFHKLAEYLVSKGHCELFNIPGSFLQKSPFQFALGNLSVDENTVKFLHFHNVNLNASCKYGKSVLMDAVTGKQSVTLLSQLISLGADPTHLDLKKRSLLHIAALEGTFESLSFLLNLGELDVNGKDLKEETPLHSALLSKIDAVKKAKLLIEKGADVGCHNNEKFTPLHQAVLRLDKESRFPMVKLLIERRADVYAKDLKLNGTFLHIWIYGDGRPSPAEFHLLAEYLIDQGYADLFNTPGLLNEMTPFHTALMSLEVKEKTLLLLHGNGANFNAVTNEGLTPLMLALDRSTGVLSTLIQLGADLHQVDKNGRNVLHSAARSGSVASLKFILELGELDVNGKDFKGGCPLHFALVSEAENVIEKYELLLGAGADVNCQNNEGISPLHLAIYCKLEEARLPLIKSLIDHGADVYATDSFRKRTFLHWWIHSDKRPTPSEFHSLVEFLVEKKLVELLNTTCLENKVSPFHLAVMKLDLEEETLELLHTAGVNFNAVDETGSSPLFYAIRGKADIKLVSSLIHFGANWNHLDSNNCNILHSSAQNGSYEALAFFLELGGLDINGRDNDGDSPLHCALLAKGADVVEKCKLLVETGAEIIVSNDGGETPLSLALRREEPVEKEQLVKLLLKNISHSNRTT